MVSGLLTWQHEDVYKFGENASCMTCSINIKYWPAVGSSCDVWMLAQGSVVAEWVNPTDAVVMFLELWTKCSLCEGIECNSWKLLVWNGISAGTDACALVSLFQIQLQQMQCITCRALGVDVCFWRAQWPWSALLGDYSNCCGFMWAWRLLQDLSQSWLPC